MTNFNLLEWLQTDSHEKQSATRDQVETKSRELPDNPRLYRYPCATLALPLRAMKYAAILLMLFCLGVGQTWGADFTPAQIVASGGTTTSNIKVSSSYTTVTTGKKLCSSQTSVDAVSISNNANANYNTAYVEVQATSGTISTLGLKIRGNADGTGAIVIVFWSGDAGSTYTSYTTSYNYIARNGSDCDGLVSVSVPSGTKTVRIYKSIRVKDGAISGASGYTTVSAGNTLNIFGITATASSSCAAADLTAGNITSNGNQEAGTGITFSKVGSPVSGDTWYWQTSSTGTDKTYNATSSYTTATTAGSYTVYLRAYNSAGDCWGTAASMTNTIYPAPSAMIHNTFAVNDAWSSTIATQDKTNITSLSAMAAVGESVGSDSNKSGLTQKIPSQSSEDAGKYMSLSFNVASGKQLNVTSVVFDEQPVTGTGTFKVSISDNQGSTTKTQTIASGAAGSKHTLTLDGDIVGSFKGTVTVKVWAYGWSDGYRFGDYFYINGTVTASCSAPTTTFANGSYTIGGSALDLSTLIGSNNSSGAITYTVKNANGTGASISTASFTASSAGTCTVTATQAANGDKCEKVMDATITVSAPAGSTWYVKGSFDSWGSGFNFTGSGTELTATVNITTAGLYEFKINNTDGSAWYGNGGNIGCNVSGWVFSTSDGNCKFFASETGNYTFTFNTETKALSVTYPTAQGKYYYKNTGSWGAVYVYRFKGDINNGWPGTQVVETETVCGDTYYFTYADPGTTLIFDNNNSSQTGDMTASSNAGKYVQGTESSWNTFPTYTVTYNKNGDGAGGAGSVTGSVPTDSNSPYACGSTVTVLGNTGSLAKDGYNFTGWNTAANGSGAGYTAGNTFTISANTTLYAQWELIPTYDVIYNTNGGTGGSTASQTGNLSGAQVTTSANGFTRSGYKFKWWNTAANGSGEDFYPGEKVTIASANVNLYAQWEEVGADWEFWVGNPSAFTTSQAVVGDMTLTAYGGGTTINTDLTADPTIVSQYNSSVNKHAICIAVASNDQYVQVSFSDGSPINSLKLWATTNQTSSKNLAVIYSTTADFSTGEYEAKTVSVPANNAASKAMTDFSPATADKYFYARIYRKVATAVYEFTGGSGNTARIYGIKAEKGHICSAPTGLSAASTTAKGTTFTVTDGDNTNNYDFYVSTSSSAPNAETSATYTSTSKTKTIDNLYAGTTFYAWVRSNCGVYGKSGWTALTGNTFTTSTVSVTHTLTNVTKTSGAATAGGSTYTAVYSANTDYSMPTPVVTIDGNTATSGTDYTWTAGTGTISIPANKVTGNIVITLNSAASAPTNVAISGGYHYYPDETISLTATATGGNGPKTYQWYKGGTADGNAIDGATSATFSKTCVAGDAGAYYCKVTCGGSASTWSDGAGHDPFNVKVMQFVLKNSSSVTISTTPLSRVDATHATVILNLTGGTTYKFRITDGCGNYFGYSTTITSVNCTDIYMSQDADCSMVTSVKTTNYTFNVDLTGGLGTGMKVSVIYPGGDQAADKVIYWDNSVLNWAAGSQWYRIGRSDHHNKTQMTLVPGTANLYKVTTAEYNNFEYWHIANNQGNGNGNLFWMKGDPAYAITNAMAFEGAPVTLAAITVTPTTSHATGETDDTNTCEFYTYTTTPNMKTQTVSITAPSNGTITVGYTDVNNAEQSFTSGSQTLAHTVIITPTVTPDTGYELSGLTVNGNAHTPGNTYTVTGTTVVAATFSLIDYTVTLNTNGGTINAGNVTSYNYGTGATLPTNVTKTGYTFDGWFDNSGLTGDAVTTISSSATGNKEFWAKWTCVTPTFGTNLSTSTVNYNVGAAASALTVAATAGGGTVTYQWYSNDENNTTTPTTLTGQTSASYTPSTAAAGTTYYYCVATNSTAGCSTTATSNITPVTVAATYTVTYQYNGATGGASPSSETAASVTLPEPTRTSYVLDGWYKTDGTKVGDGGDTYNPTADVTLYARWETNCAGGSSTATFNFNSGNSTGLTIENSQASWSYSIVNSTTNNIPVLDSYFLALSFASTSTGTITVTTNDSYASIDSIKFNSASTDNSNPKVAIFTVAGSPETETSRLSAIAVSSGTTKTWRATPYKLDLSATKPTGKVRFKFTTGSSGKYAGFDNIQIFYGAGSGTCYSVKYCGNGAESGYVSDPTSYAANDDPVVLGNVGLYPFVRSGYTLTGWNTEAGGGGTAYAAGATITDISSDVTLYAQWTPTVNYSVTHSLTNVTATSGATGASAATGYTAYNAVFEAAVGYNLPSTITVTIGGETATETTDYTWNSSTGALEILAASVTGNIVITIAGEVAPTTKDIYYGAITITAGALTKGSTGTSQFFTNIGGTIANNTEISWTSGPSAGAEYYESNDLTDTELSKSSNWTSSSGSNRYVGGMKFQSGSTYTLALGSKVATAITFYGRNGSASKTMTVGGQSWTSSSTKNTFAKHVFTKDGNFTGNVTISQDGDFYGILVITIQTATPCTTPVIPSLSDQTVCPGADIAAWNATQTASLQTGESASYSWKKKGSDTELATTASFDLGSSATESQAGTYVVTVTVSALGKASASASKEVTLTVTPATETPSITASKAKVYATDEVIFTATCGSTGVTWQWYRCTNAGGTITGSCLSTTSSYTLASAPAAGTYYYKAVATGDGTHSCGTAEYVYTLVVSAANSCDKEFWFAKEADRPTGAAAATHITGCPSGSSSASYTASIDGTNYTLTGSTGQKTGNVTIVVPADNTGTLYVVVQGSSSRTITLSKGGTQIGQETPENSTWGVFTFDNLDAGTYTLVSSGNISWAMMALKLCPTVACTDDTPTAAATNATVCAGGSITITATGYETGATFQWQKQNASTSVWENIDGATSDTYTVATAAAEHAGNYHIVATMGCARTSNTVTIAVPSAPVFNSFTTTRRVMETQALSISDVSATDAVSYTWYKSADATWDAGDTEIGTSKNLLKPYAGETAGSTYYVICRAANSCGTTTSSTITVTVQTLVEEDCAIVGNSGEHNTFAKTSNVSSGTYGSITELHTNSNNKYIYYTAESGYYFAKATVNACVGNASDLPTAAYSYSTDGGANWTDQNLTGMTTAYADHVINLPANVNAFRVGRRLGDCGTSSNTIYIHQVCFEYNENCTKTTVNPSSAAVDYEIGDPFTAPTFTVKHNNVAFDPQPTITYTSSDETVATVDDDGTVNFQDKAGTVVITAAYAGDATYCESEGSYTITVSCSDEAPKIIAADGTNIGGCNDEITLEAKMQDGTTNFSDGTYQWYRDGEAISGATGRTYTVSLTGVYSVERTSVGGCVSPSSNKATVTSESAEPEVERLTPFQYYHVDKVYAETSIMRFRHLFAVKNAGTTLEGKHFKMELSRNGGAATDVTNSNAFVMSADTVLLDMNKLYGKYEEDDELVLTCSAVDCEGNVSSIYKNTITIYVIDETPTLALICSGASGDGTRKTSNLVVGGDFLTGYNKADLCVQTGNTSFDKTQEWVLYTRLKENYIVTPVNGYAPFNKLNYEPFDILFLTDYPKASKSDAAATILDDMADLCDYRPLFTFKTHMVHKSPSKWAAKGFMAQPEVPKQSRLRLNIVCYAHPMFSTLKETSTHIQKDANDHSQIVYTMLEGPGHEGSKGMQGFPIDAAEGFVTIGLIHDDAMASDNTPSVGYVTWTSGSSDVMLVAAAERQVNLEARMILFSVNCGAQSKLTETGRQVVLKSLEYLLSDATITPVADCSFTFTNGAGNTMTDAQYKEACDACTGSKGDGKWSTAANWAPDWILQPGKDTEVKIAAHATVDMPRAQVRAVRILEGGSIDIPAGNGLEVKSTIRRQDGTEISPTEVADLSIGSTIDGNGTLILNNNAGDTKAGVAMYSKGFIDYTDPSKPKGIKNYQYIGVPFTAVNALYNYYGSWLYSWSDKGSGYGWQKVPNGDTVTAWTGYCITQETATTHWSTGTLAATGTVDIPVPAGENMVVGNSWTAPIYVKEFTNDDFENLLGNVYFFNTGVDKTGEAGAAETRYQSSTYVTVPIHSSPYTGDSLISSMQGFFVKSNGSAGALHLDYDRHVRPTTNRNILSGQMHAPRRAQATDTDEPVVLKIKVSGENYDDKLVLLGREDFSEGFDNGWDGDKWDGNESALYLYTTDSEGTENSVSAVPELEGTVIGFRAGEDDEYTMYFDYLNGDEKLYLWDTETGDYTVIKTGYAYAFTTADKEKHARFIITRSNGEEVATDLTPTLSQGEGAKAKKLLIGNKMYIMVDGRLFDATGKIVK